LSSKVKLNAAGRAPRLNRLYPWVVVGIAFVSVGAAFGTRAAFALFFVAVLEEFQWSRGLSAGVLTLGSVAWTLTAPLLGYLLDRWGPRVVIPAGAVVMAAGFVVSSMAQNVLQFYIGMGLLVGLGFAALPMTSQATIISNWFIRKRGMAMGIAASGIGVGILVLVPATQLLIDGVGWRDAYLVLAGVLVVTIVPLNAIFQRRRPADMGLLPDFGETRLRSGSGGGHRDQPGKGSLGRALASLRFWLLSLGVLTGAVPLHMVLVHQVAAMVDVGFSKELSASMLGLTGFFTIFTMVGMGTLSDRIGREWAYSLGTLCLVGAILVLLLVADSSQLVLIYVFPPLFAVGFSSRQSLYPTIAADLFHGRHFGSIIGVVALFIGAGAGVGPWLGGYLHDVSGDYGSSFLTAIVLSFLSLGFIWLAAPRRGGIP
jgi:MFS family permease